MLRSLPPFSVLFSR